MKEHVPTTAFFMCLGITFRNYIAQKGDYLLSPFSSDPWTILPLLSLFWYFPQFGASMGKSGKYNSSMVTSLIPLSSSLIASRAKCLERECVKHSNSTIIVSGSTDPERILFIAPLGKLNQIKPCFIYWGRRLFLIVRSNSLFALIRNSSKV